MHCSVNLKKKRKGSKFEERIVSNLRKEKEYVLFFVKFRNFEIRVVPKDFEREKRGVITKL